LTDAEYEQRLRARLELLKDEMAAGRVVFAPEVAPNIGKSLSAVRYGRDGQIDLATVDGRVRALALAVESGKYRRDLKAAVSIKDLQQGYFDAISANFGNLHKQMVKGRAAPRQVARSVSRDKEAVKSIAASIPKFLNWVEDLWREAHEIARIHVEDMGGLKAIFGGELFPTGPHNVASTCGVYVDSIVLPEPFLRARLFLTEGPDESRVYWLVNQALGLLNYKTLALAELDTPIVILAPDAHQFDPHELQNLMEISDPDVVAHLNALYGGKFKTIEEAANFLQRFETPSQAIAGLQDRSRLLFEIGVSEPLEQQLQNYIDDYTSLKGIKHAGQAVLAKALGRMRQANDVLIRSRALHGTPLIDAPVSWQYFNWKLQYDLRRLDPRHTHELHLVRALQSAARTEMTWLGKVPPKALIEMRKVGALPELRDILSRGVAELVASRPDNFFRTGDQVVENIQAAFDEHRKQVSKLRGKKWRFAGVELGACVVRGVIEVAAACGVPLVSLAKAALDQIIEIPKLKQLPGKYRMLRDESQKLHNSPVGLLFNQSHRR
jgi:hypothetical protein